MAEPTVEPTTGPASRPTPSIERHVDVDAPPAEVWETLADPAELGEWLGAEVDLELVPGAAGHVVDPDGTTRQVLVTAVEQGQRVAWHWWADDGELSSVEITTVPFDGGTRVRVIETVAWSSGPTLRASGRTLALARA